MKFKKIIPLPARALSRMRHSIRTRYALATGAFLLLVLAVFYIGGRVVLVHLVKDSEQSVREIGTDVNRVAIRNSERVKSHVQALPAETLGNAPASFLGPKESLDVALALRLAKDGAFAEGVISGKTEPETLAAADLQGYAKNLPRWSKTLTDHLKGADKNGFIAAGILHVRDRSYYSSIAQAPDGTFLILGTPFNAADFTDQVNSAFKGMEVRITTRKIPVAAGPAASKDKAEKAFGIVPPTTEASNYQSDSIWQLDDNPVESVYTIRDIAGNPVSMIAISLPKTVSNAAGTAIGHMAVFITVFGILLVLVIFWFQGHVLLNPLSLMTACVQQAREQCDKADCPRVVWNGDDEFAELAFSVNGLLEAISNRAVAVAQVENRQKALISCLPDGLMVFDRNHRLVSIIKQPVGFPPVPGFTERSPIAVDVFGSDGVQAFGKAVDQAFATEKLQTLTLECGAQPHKRWFDVSLTLTDKFFVLAIVRDVTETMISRNRRRAAETRLQHVRKQESLSLLAGSIAHDVNNILASILNTIEITFMGTDDEEVLEMLTTVRDAVYRGSVMSKELMTFAGEMKISLQHSDPVQLVLAAKRVADGVVGKNVTVRYDLPETLPAVDADPDQLWKVFFNLIKNAGEAMDGVGEIRVSAQPYMMTDDLSPFFFSTKPLPAGPGILITVADSGPGIPKDMLRRIFDPYVSTKSAGRGFGLATVNTIVDAHHGGIRVESKLGHGTAFGIFLPLSKIAAAPTPPPQEVAAAPAAQPSETASVPREVLLVDDDPAILKTTGILLKVLKCTVHATSGHTDALEIFHRRADKLSCVILDAHLGSTDPVRLLATFRATAPNVPIIVTSGSAIETVQEIFASQPYDAFLAKPFTLADLKKAIES